MKSTSFNSINKVNGCRILKRLIYGKNYYEEKCITIGYARNMSLFRRLEKCQEKEHQVEDEIYDASWKKEGLFSNI